MKYDAIVGVSERENHMSKEWLRRFLILLSDYHKSKIKKRRRRLKWVGLVNPILAFVIFGVTVEAQQPTKVPRIGFLIATATSVNTARNEAFRQGLRELGYVDGKNIVIEWRSAEGKSERLPGLAAELVGLKVDIIVSGGPITTRAAKQATTTIPIVMAQDPDPVGSGFVISLARPSGNITGLATLTPGLSGKRLELLKEIIPKLSRVAIFGTSSRPGNAQELREVELAAGAFKVQLQNSRRTRSQGY